MSSDKTTTDVTSSAGESESTDDNTASTRAGLGQAARDGKFEFTVQNIECGTKTVGDPGSGFGDTAQGKYCFVSMRVRNIASEPQTLFADNQKLYDAGGKQYSADDSAWIYLPQSQQAVWEEINPGNEVSGTVIFDIPDAVTPTEIELHDSAFSDGVRVNLS